MKSNQQMKPERRGKGTTHCLGEPRSSESKPLLAGEEEQIVHRAIAGNSEALSMLFARESVRHYRTAFSVLRNKEDSEDALQNGLLSAYLNLASFEGRSKFSTWLTRIVPNAALMNRRKRRILPQMSIDEIAVGKPQPWTSSLCDPHPGPAFARSRR